MSLTTEARNRYLARLCFGFESSNRVVACRAATEAGGSPNLAKAFAGEAAQDGSPTVFVCENFTCQSPIIGKEAARKMWGKLTIAGKGT